MYIREIKICGFKTYRDETTISFHPGCNCIVGLNGSGKSNILAAIQFLFSDDYGSTSVERQGFLHEGLGSQVPVAYVELILDNVGRRLSIYDEDFVSIKRTFRSSSQKNEWQISGKNVTKKDFDSILESCGISRNNPYFIVQQGKVMELATMSDISRLKLLREIAGTRTYDERREESIKLLFETDTRKMKVDSVFEDIQKRIDTLKDEQREFRAFLNLDKRRRTLEFLINEFEWEEASQGEQEYYEKLSKARDKLNKIEEDINNSSLRLQSLLESRNGLDIRLEDLEHKRKEIQSKISQYSKSVADLDFEKSEHFTQHKTPRLNISENEMNREISSLELKMSNDRELVQKYKKELHSLLKEANSLHQLESALISKHEEANYSSVDERNISINKKIEYYLTEKGNLDVHLNSIQNDLLEKNNELNKLDSNIQFWNEEHNTNQRLFESLVLDIQRNNEKRQLNIERKHEINKVLYQKSNNEKLLSNQILGLEKNLNSRMKYSIRQGIELAQKFCADRNMWRNGSDNTFDSPEVFGTILDNINVDDTYALAVEVAAGNNLHNLIVKDKDIATEIIAYIKSIGNTRDQCFGSNFSIVLSPLDEIESINRQGIKGDIALDKAAIPMINVIQFDNRIKSIIEQVFGNYYIVENLEMAKYLVDRYKVNCITLDGDEWNNKGCIRGGGRGFSYIGAKQNSIIAMWKQLKNLNREKSTLNSELSEIKGELNDIEDLICNLNSEKEELLNNRESLISRISKSKEMVHLYECNRRNIQSVILKVTDEEEKAMRNIETVQNYLLSLKKELSSEFLSQGLTFEEEELLNRTISRIRALEHCEIPKIEKELAELSSKIERDEVHLNTLYRDYYYIQEERREETFEILNYDHLDINGSLNEYNRVIHESNILLSEVVAEIDSIKKQIVQFERNKDSIMQEESLTVNRKVELENLVSSLQKRYDKFRHAKEIALQERTRLSAYPNFAPDVSFPKEKNKVYQELQKVQKKISEEYKVVNRKVIAELDQFVQEYTDLSERHRELNSAMTSIQNLINTLDIQKEKTLLKNFEEINFYFNQVFKELIPGGDAKLFLKLSGDKRSKPNDENRDKNSLENSDVERSFSINRYKNESEGVGDDSSLQGIGIRVSFYSGTNSQMNTNSQRNSTGQIRSYYSLNQLSGGQKTLVALAFLFALHRADPAPMYLLDEVDAALDDQYRWSIANLIKKQSISTQFIVTTFRPQLLEVADRCFQVSQINRSSFVNEITKLQALELQQEQYQKQKNLELT
ncbi:Structural maintenance of chromosomes protein 3 [Cryptosporidium felis]|nr:Structural maintenance of chromosomes protein 3 [Cryptosporidium felis]